MAEGYDDVVLTVATNSANLEIEGVLLGETELTATTDYTLTGKTITLLKEYLDGLTEGDKVFTIATNMFNVTATIEIVDTTEG